jgi:hypothetical protein
LNVAKIPPAAVTASQMARIAPRIVPIFRPMDPVCPLVPPGALGPCRPSRSAAEPCGPAATRLSWSRSLCDAMAAAMLEIGNDWTWL